MAIAFVAVGNIVVNSTTVTLNVVPPALSINDIMICTLIGKDNIDHSGPSGWAEIGTQTNNTTGMTTSQWYKRAVALVTKATILVMNVIEIDLC